VVWLPTVDNTPLTQWPRVSKNHTLSYTLHRINLPTLTYFWLRNLYQTQTHKQNLNDADKDVDAKVCTASAQLMIFNNNNVSTMIVERSCTCIHLGYASRRPFSSLLSAQLSLLPWLYEASKWFKDGCLEPMDRSFNPLGNVCCKYQWENITVNYN